jgi:subtilisin family serine protease
MSRRISALACLIILVFTLTPITHRLYAQESDRVPNQILIKFKPGVQPQQKVSLSGVLKGAKPLDTFSCLPDWALLRLPEGTSVSDVLSTLSQDPDFAKLTDFAEPNYLWRVAQRVPDDPLFPDQWALHNTGQEDGRPGADIKALDVWRVTQGSPDILIGVLDTGIELEHPDLVNNLWVNKGEIPDNGIDDDKNGYIDDVHGWNTINNTGSVRDDHTYSHGTKVAGIIGAVGNNGIGIAGINWHVKLVALKALDANGVGTSSSIVSAVCYALHLNEMGYNIRILSSSWGGPNFSWIISDIIQGTESQFLFVAAAGNEGVDISKPGNEFYPASYNNANLFYDIPNLLSVAASTRRDEMWDGSNYSPRLVHLAAPGAAILSTTRLNGPQRPYALDYGTSLAAAYVAGVAGLLLSLNPDLAIWNLKYALVEGGDSVEAMKGQTISGKRLSAIGSVDYMKNLP